MAFFEDEPSAVDVERLLAEAEGGQHRLLLSVIKWGEVYYAIMRSVSQKKAERQVKEISGMPIELVPVDATLGLVRRLFLKRPKKCPRGLLCRGFGKDS